METRGLTPSANSLFLPTYLYPALQSPPAALLSALAVELAFGYKSTRSTTLTFLPDRRLDRTDERREMRNVIFTYPFTGLRTL